MSAAGPVATGDGWWSRLDRAEEDIRHLERVFGPVQTDVQVMKSEIASVTKSVDALSTGVQSLRNAILGFALTVAGSAAAAIVFIHP